MQSLALSAQGSAWVQKSSHTPPSWQHATTRNKRSTLSSSRVTPLLAKALDGDGERTGVISSR